MSKKKIAIIGGGTVSKVRPHLALSAPAYGTVARQLFDLCIRDCPALETHMYLTKMAGGKKLETNADVSNLVDTLIEDSATKIIFMTAALCDFEGEVLDSTSNETRLSSNVNYVMKLTPADKIISKIRKTRKDIFLIGFKTTAGATEDEQYIAGLNLCKGSSCNLVLANDIKTRVNMVITPEEARYHVTTNRMEALAGLVDMAKFRSHLTFTRSTVIAGNAVPWNSPEVPETLRNVVDWCVEQGAYKPHNGVTVGHFACKLKDNEFLTSMRRVNFNKISEIGLVRVVTDGPDHVFAYGAKCSVGGQSQRIVFQDHPDYDCIVHFHSPIREGSKVPVVSQRLVECGSHICGINTSNGLKKFGNLSAVFLDNHGPNIAFHHSIDPQEVISFIQNNFDLSQKTGGYVSSDPPDGKVVRILSTYQTAREVLT